MTRFLLAVLVAACGASTPPPPPPNGVATPDAASDAAVAGPPAVDAMLPPDAPAPVTTCSATFARMPDRASCAGAEGTACTFAEGTCTCGPQSYCGGARPPEELLAELAKPVWQCKPVRTDGCPAQLPTGTCKTPGKVCDYGDCCQQTATCTKGRWELGPFMCPP